MFANQSPQPLKILLAVDGSEHAMAAAKLVHDLPLPFGSQVNVVAVMIPREAGLKTYPLTHFIEQVSQMLQDKGIMIETELRTGNPAVELIQVAKQTQTDLIVMGAKGLRHTLGILLGGVAQQVVEHAHCPVLVVRAPYVGVRNILMVTDGSAESECAVDFMAKFPFCREAKVEVMHVLPPVPTSEIFTHSFSGSSEPIYVYPTEEEEAIFRQYLEEEKKKAELLLEQTETRLKAASVFARTVLLRGDAATEIIKYIQENQIDLVVAGSRGLGGFESWLLGSVSRKILHYAGCSVLVVKK